jgi:hypothetical protein
MSMMPMMIFHYQSELSVHASDAYDDFSLSINLNFVSMPMMLS